MHLENIILTNFKNYENETFHFSPEINCLTGKESKQTPNQILSKKSQSKVPGSNANPIVPDGEETQQPTPTLQKEKRNGNSGRKENEKDNVAQN